jgi:hypothetical protein
MLQMAFGRYRIQGRIRFKVRKKRNDNLVAMNLIIYERAKKANFALSSEKLTSRL